MKYLIILFAIFAVVSAQIVSDGQCNNVKVVDNFNIPEYGGLWYEIYRYDHVNQPNGSCVTAQYTLNEFGNVTVLNSMVVSGQPFSIQGTAAPAPNSNGTAKLLVNFPTADNKFSDYWVLSTDYTNYSLVYACTNITVSTKRVSSWILSRAKTLSPQSVVAMNPALEAADGLEWDSYMQTAQTETACKINFLRY